MTVANSYREGKTVFVNSNWDVVGNIRMIYPELIYQYQYQYQYQCQPPETGDI